MLTDAAPKGSNRASFLESDLLRNLDLPPGGNLTTIASFIESTMEDGTTASVRRTCAHFLAELAGFYEVPACGLRVLAARPLRVRERGTIELFGDYRADTRVIRVWMRTAVRKEVTSFGTSGARSGTGLQSSRTTTCFVRQWFFGSERPRGYPNERSSSR